MQVTQLSTRASSSKSLRQRPFSSSLSRRRVSLPVSAQDSPPSTSEVPAKVVAPVPVLEWKQDTEGFKELMGFGGSAPERANGRAAMIGFVAAMAAELSSGASVVDQFSDAAATVILVNVLLGIGTVAPKFFSGTALSELHAAASGANLVGDVQDWTQVLKVFDQNVELWSGRLAMLGMLGLVSIEAVTGNPFF